MAKKKKGPRQAVGLKCSVCSAFNYITEYNKNNDQLQKQTKGDSAFPLEKYCKKCRVHTKHTVSKKLK